MAEKKQFFFGSYEHTLDAQCRFSLPSEWRNRDGETVFVLLPGRDNDLQLLPNEIFQETMEKAGRFAVANRHLQAAFAYIGSQARYCRCDKHGRVAVEREKLDSVGIDRKLKLIGAITYIRICSPVQWQTPTPEAINSYWDEVRKLSEKEGGQ